MIKSFAIYRLPGDSCCTLMEQDGEPIVLRSISDLNGRAGFVLAPFTPTPESPLLLLEPEKVTTMTIGQMSCNVLPKACMDNAPQKPLLEGRNSYAIDFASFHAQLMEGYFQKLVLARNVFVSGIVKTPVDLFRQACECYPQAFVAMASTPLSGTWLMATPEILLEGQGGGMAHNGFGRHNGGPPLIPPRG